MGFGSNGYTIQTRSEIETELQTAQKEAFGVEIGTGANTRIGQFNAIMSEREYRVQQTSKQVYDSQTLNGAEGIFLDEVFSKRGVYRKGSQRGSGDEFVQLDNTSPDSQELGTTIKYNGTNGQQYIQDIAVVVKDNVIAYKLLYSQLNTVSNISFTYEDKENSTTATANLGLPDLSQASKEAFLGQLKTFLDTHLPNKTVINTEGLYLGFTNSVATGLDSVIGLTSTPSFGNRYVKTTSTAKNAGYYPLPVDGINGMNPVPIGYVGVTNPVSFSSGSVPETDAEYYVRAMKISNGANGVATRPAIISALLKVTGVTKVKILKEIVNDVVEVTPIVVGGSTPDIAKSLYNTQPVDCIYKGNTSYVVDTQDLSTETIHFSRGTETPLSVKVTYTTETGTSLSITEKAQISNNLIELSAKFDVGGTIFNAQLLSAVYNAVDYGRFSSLVVSVKKVSDPDGSYTSNNYTPSTTELPTLNANDITYPYGV